MDILDDDIVGQIKPKEILFNIFNSGRVPQAIIFNGPSGTGRHKLALNFLKLLNSKNSNAGKFLFKQIDSYNEPYVKLILPLPSVSDEGKSSAFENLKESQITEIQNEIAEKSQNPYHQIQIQNAHSIKINSIREISRFVSFKFNDVDYRGIIISEAHLLTAEAQNAMLKNLEEPPEGNIFFLITNDVNKLLPTIRSRCWILKFTPLTDEQVEQILINKFEFQAEMAKLLSVLSEGSVARALEFSKYDVDFLFESVITILRYSLGRRYLTAIEALTNAVAHFDSKVILILISLILKWFNDVERFKAIKEVKYFSNYLNTIEKFISGYKNVNLFTFLSRLNSLINYSEKNVNSNVVIINTIFTLAEITIENRG